MEAPQTQDNTPNPSQIDFFQNVSLLNQIWFISVCFLFLVSVHHLFIVCLSVCLLIIVSLKVDACLHIVLMSRVLVTCHFFRKRHRALYAKKSGTFVLKMHLDIYDGLICGVTYNGLGGALLFESRLKFYPIILSMIINLPEKKMNS